MQLYLNPKEAAKYYNVSCETLRRWADEGKIETTKTEGGHRRYKIEERNKEGKKYIYGRVSSKKQEFDLQRQIDFIKDKYPNHEVISDIGSGLNFKREGFRRILEQLFERDIEEVVISSSDRFSRFGTREFFGWLFFRFGAKLTILKDETNESPEVELSEDLLEILTVFTARYHGRRNYSNNKKDKDNS